MQTGRSDNPEGVSSTCLGCGRSSRRLPESPCADCASPHVAPLIFLLTSTALSGFLCVLAWQLEAFVAGVHLLAGRQVNAAGHVALFVTSSALTLFAGLKGRRELAHVRALGGRSAITSSLAVLIVLTLLVFSALIVAFIDWQIG